MTTPPQPAEVAAAVVEVRALASLLDGKGEGMVLHLGAGGMEQEMGDNLRVVLDALAAAERLVGCDDCGFSYSADHVCEDGQYRCPVCELHKAETERDAAEARATERCGAAEARAARYESEIRSTAEWLDASGFPAALTVAEALRAALADAGGDA